MCATEQPESINTRGSQTPRGMSGSKVPRAQHIPKALGAEACLPGHLPGALSTGEQVGTRSSTSEAGWESTVRQGGRAKQLTSEFSLSREIKAQMITRGEFEDKGTLGNHARELYPRGTEEAEKI